MSDTNNLPKRGNDALRGQNVGALPDRGTSTGMNPGADPVLDGQSTDQSSTNSMGMDGTKSDSEGTPFGGKSQRI